MMSPDESASPTPTTLAAALGDRYRVERVLAHGGMATVYVAEDIRHGRRVAIKVLRTELAAVMGAERFLREIRTTATLQHSHILGLIDSGEAGGLLYYVMPLVEGKSLRGRLTREHQLPVDDEHGAGGANVGGAIGGDRSATCCPPAPWRRSGGADALGGEA